MKDWEAQIHRALTHPIRRQIISYLQEKTYGSFTDLLKYAGIRDHGKLGFHLRSLGELIEYDDQRKSYYLTDIGELAAELIWENRFDLIEIIHFTEEVSAKIHGVLDKDEIFRIVKEEFVKSEKFNMVILLLTDDSTKLRIKEMTLDLKRMNVGEREVGIGIEKFDIDLEKTRILSQVIRDDKTLQIDNVTLVREFLPRSIAERFIHKIGLKNQPQILTPLTRQEEIIGVLAMSSTNLANYFIPSVRSLAQHISNALELAEEYTKRRSAEEKLKEYSERLEVRAREWVKELTCLYMVIKEIQAAKSLEELGPRIVELLVPAMQFPELSAPVVLLGNRVFAHSRYTDELFHGIHAEVQVDGQPFGSVYVYYTEDHSFLIPKEQNMLNAIAELVGRWFERKLAQNLKEIHAKEKGRTKRELYLT